MQKSILKFLFPALLATYALSACIPVVLVAAGATVGGAIIYDKRSIKTIAQDRDMASTALKQISEDPDLKDKVHITIATFNNMMLIAGQAPTEELKNHAYQIASSATNLKRIYNEITVEPITAASTQTQDTWITTKAKSAMLAEKGLSSTQIKVVTENKVVYLLGVVTHKQADLAADVASTVSGVSRVVRLFEYE
jgi:osmotically-inducible protein OsmY